VVEDLLERLGEHPDYDLTVFFWPAGGEGELLAWLGPDYTCRPQRGDNLGERMAAALAETLDGQAGKSIIIGSDIPDLDNLTINGAFSALDLSEVVLGPGRDGGYYLIGLNRPTPELFQNISWGGERVYQETLEAVRRLELSCTELDLMDDLDTFKDIQAYWRRLNEGKAARNPRLTNFCRNFFDRGT
jgi:rSAM/selenodomain-associated transferase 1